MKENFNKKVYELREEKIKLLRKYQLLQQKLEEIHDDLDTEDRIYCPALPKINIQAEFPEMQFQVLKKIPDTFARFSVGTVLFYTALLCVFTV